MTMLAQGMSSEGWMLWGFLLLAGAIGLLFIEVFVPSGGLLALLAGVAVIGSVLSFFMHSSTTGFVALGLYMVLGPVALWIGFRIWAASPMGRRMVLGVQEQGAAPTSGSADELVGRTGKTITVLRPVGKVTIDGRRMDAMAETNIIEADTPIVVTEVYDNQVKVRPTDDSPSDPRANG